MIYIYYISLYVLCYISYIFYPIALCTIYPYVYIYIYGYIHMPISHKLCTCTCTCMYMYSTYLIIPSIMYIDPRSINVLIYSRHTYVHKLYIYSTYPCIYIYVYVYIYMLALCTFVMHVHVHVLFLSQPPVYNHVNVYVFSHVFIHVSTESHVGLHSCGSRPDHGFDFHNHVFVNNRCVYVYKPYTYICSI